MRQASRRLTILHTESSLGWGGQERRILTEAAALRQQGHRLLLAADPQAEIYRRGQAAGFQVFPLPFSRRLKLAAVLALRRLLRQIQPDILNTHSSLDSWVGLAASAGLRRRLRLVRTRHLGLVIQRTWPTRFLYQQADAIITTGTTIREMIHARARVPLERLHAIPTGISLTEFAPRPRAAIPGFPPPHWPPDALIIGSIAILRFGKGHLYLVDALAQVVRMEPRVRLVIVGDGPAREAIRTRIRELGLDEVVFLAGFQEQVADWLSWLEIVILPSYVREGVPQILLQAMAMERAVIGTDCGGIAEIVLPGQTGLLVPPRQVEPLAAAILSLLRQPDLRQQLGRQGRRLVARQYSVEAMAEAVENLYLRLTDT